MKELLKDGARNQGLRWYSKEGGMAMDHTHCKVDAKAMELLGEVAKET